MNKQIKRCAPTAKAAFLIRGQTFHNLFTISVKNDKDVYQKITDPNRLQALQQKFVGITHIIIDEYLMFSQVMLAIIDNRLRQATGIDQYFAGLSVILTGDPGQLLPVAGASLYQYPPSSVLAKHGYNCYRQFEKVIQLDITVRQQNVNGDVHQENLLSYT